jgi:outer membrane protein OmpA-like peptidoglycan-associated protein
MFVTAEPYFAISSPSNVVVLENVKADRTTGTISTVTPRFDLVEKGEYFAAGLEPFLWDARQPRDLFQARNAVRIAEWQGAAQYAPSALEEARQVLLQAELDDQRRGNNRNRVIQASRQAVQLAEGARVTTERSIRDEQLERQRIEAAERAAAAEASRIAAAEEAERQSRARAEAEAARQEAEIARHEAEAARLAAEKARSDAAGEAEVARIAADQARQMLEQAQAEMQRLEADRQELRQRLLTQFNMILETRDTARGLILNMGDVLFDVGKSDLRFEAREKLARLSGLLLAHPELTLEIEGHTDSTGSDELNQTLSEQRAEAVRSYLVGQGVGAESVTARGLGKTMPIADNSTSAGRQQNRRVEIVVSGEALGEVAEQVP